ncbi:hypothetical protein D3C86_1303540 [compost metagenome]
MRVTRRDVRVAGQHTLAVLGLLDRDAAQAVQPLRERFGEAGRHMLDDHHGRAVRRQRHQEFLDGLGAARGRAHNDQLFRRQQRRAQQRRRRRAFCRALGAGGPHPGTRRRADLVGDGVRVLHQPVADAQLGLGDEVHRTQFQRAHGDFGPALGQRRHHQHRHGPQAHQTLEEIEPVHARHFHVQRQHVRVQALDEVARHQRIGGGAHHFHVCLAVDDLGHQAADQRGIVHAQHLDLRGGHIWSLRLIFRSAPLPWPAA